VVVGVIDFLLGLECAIYRVLFGGLRAEARTLNDKAGENLVAAEKVGTFVCRSEFGDTPRGHKVRRFYQKVHGNETAANI
jgi:hypothetical protein